MDEARFVWKYNYRVFQYFEIRLFTKFHFNQKVYSLSVAGYTCTDIGQIPVDDVAECRKTIPFIQSIYLDISENIDKEESYWYLPKACYVFTKKDYNSGEYGIFFNRHITGSRDKNSRQVCKQKTNGRWIRK